jgi:hypothetical protein
MDIQNFTLEQLLDIKQNFEKILDKKLLMMDVFFQNYLWDGFTDPEDPKFISTDDFDGIEALTEKIKHMVCNIGCPISVLPMLQSISERKIKHWQSSNNVETEDKKVYHYNTENKTGSTIERMGFKKGKQLRNNDEIRRVYDQDGYYHIKIEDRVISGHFRWNNRGYTLSRRCTDLLSDYINN